MVDNLTACFNTVLSSGLTQTIHQLTMYKFQTFLRQRFAINISIFLCVILVAFLVRFLSIGSLQSVDTELLPALKLFSDSKQLALISVACLLLIGVIALLSKNREPEVRSALNLVRAEASSVCLSFASASLLAGAYQGFMQGIWFGAGALLVGAGMTVLSYRLEP